MEFLRLSAIVLILFSFLSCNNNDDSTGPEDGLPVLTTIAISEVTQTTAESGGNITSEGGTSVTSRGVCWSTNQTPTISDNLTSDGTGIGSFTSSITGLTPNTIYYVRAYATNSEGTGYGDVSSFTTLVESNTVTDIDGNVYQTVTIGDQVWMAENLKVTHYRNGDEIPFLSSGSDLWSWSQDAYGYYNDQPGHIENYGLLYNWNAVEDSRNIAPAGWHVPTLSDWQTLIIYLGGEVVAGGKMKDVGTSFWTSPNTGATNESGFTALGAGYRRSVDGVDVVMGYSAKFWSSDDYTNEFGHSLAWYLSLSNNNASAIIDGFDFKPGLSVRCIKD